jgi:aminoglycoside phosphotransferase (APT) family kinase protein
MTEGRELQLMRAALERLGLLREGEAARFTPLPGGVSSDILRVDVGARTFCVKRALPRLKVAALWEAPIARNAAEAAWMRSVGHWLPDCVPQLLGEDAATGLFAMAYLPAEHYPVWKQRLSQGQIDPEFAAQVGLRLAQIHARSADDAALAAAFANDATFESIRIEPYLRATALHHPDLADRLTELAGITLTTKRALVHGDVSPKNLLCGPRGPLFLDAECACYGDPAFDLAFCLNHLLLKGSWQPRWKARYLTCFDALVAAYMQGVTWEPPEAIERRSAHLLPGLWLARVDGKSPVEYLSAAASRDQVRRAARTLLLEPVERLADIRAFWAAFR